METENTRNEQMEIARIRFGLIAPMVQGTSRMNPCPHTAAGYPLFL